jgi:hypothetical protein
MSIVTDNTETPERNCAFQFAYTRPWRGTTIVEDKSELTLDEAKELLRKHKPQIIKLLKDKVESMEAVIWINMEDKHSYGDSLIYITQMHETDGKEIWETKRHYVEI